MTTTTDKHELAQALTNALDQYCFDTDTRHMLHILLEDGNYTDGSLSFLNDSLNLVIVKDWFWHLQKTLLMLYQSTPESDRYFLMYGINEL